MSFSKVYRLILIVLLFFGGGFCSAQDGKYQADDDHKTYIERSKTIAVFYKLLNQDKAPTVKEAFLIFHPEMEWSVAYTVHADDQEKALEIEFVFPIHPDHYNKVSNIYLENGESILKLIGAK